MTSEAQKEYNRRYYLKNREALVIAERARRTAPEYNAKGRLRYARIRDKRTAMSRAYYHRNKAKRAVYQKAWYGRSQSWIKQYRINARASNAAREAVRRARKQSASAQPALAKKFYDYVRSREFIYCYYCNGKINGKDAHIDHVIALARGGNHVSENLAASCAPCNQSKNDKMPSEWDKHRQMFLNL